MRFQPKNIGREFVRWYYTVLNRSPDQLHCFYDKAATFIHDDIDPTQQKTVSVVGKQAICEVMKLRQMHYRHTCTVVNAIDTAETIDSGLVVQVFGEISYNDKTARSFSQTFVLMAASPIKYYVLNEIFRFRDFLPSEPVQRNRTETESSMASYDMNATFIDNSHMNGVHEEDSAMGHDESGESIDELQSKHLKSLLHDSLNKDGRMPTYRKQIESAVPVTVAVTGATIEQISETAQKLFQDKCIITVGGVINPNIKFEEEEKTDHVEMSSMESQTIAFAETKPKKLSKSKRKKLAKSQSKESDDMKLVNSSGESNEKPNEDENRNVIEPTAPIVEASEVTDRESLPTTVQTMPKPPEGAEVMSKLSEMSKKESPALATDANVETNSAVVDAKDDEREEPVELATPVETIVTKPVSYAELLKIAREKTRSSSLPTLSTSTSDLRKNSLPIVKDKPLIIRNSMRRRSDKISPPRHRGNNKATISLFYILFQNFNAFLLSSLSPTDYRSDNVLQVFIGNIVQSATDDDLRRLFSPFGAIARLRIHSNIEKSWLPHYAFVTYENIDAVRRCLKKRNSFWFPESGPNRLKLNVNGDESIVMSDNEEKTDTNQPEPKQRRDLKKFSKDFVLTNSTATSKATKNESTAAADRNNNNNKKNKGKPESRQLACERVHGGRDMPRRIPSKA